MLFSMALDDDERHFLYERKTKFDVFVRYFLPEKPDYVNQIILVFFFFLNYRWTMLRALHLQGVFNYWFIAFKLLLILGSTQVQPADLQFFVSSVTT